MEKKEKTIIDYFNFKYDKMILANIILTAIFLIFGIIIYLKPMMAIKTVGIIIGIAFILFGIFAIIEYLTREINPIFNLKLIYGILCIILGLFTIIDPFKLVKLLTLTLGIYLVIVAIFKIIEAFKLKKYGFDGWVLTLVVSILLLIFGIFIGINPMVYVDFVEATGIFIILASILELANLLMLYTKAKDIVKLIKKRIKE